MILNVFRKICVNRSFEFNLKKVYDTGIIKMPIYLSIGQEHIPAAISEVFPKPLIFRQHRGHSTYLSFGGDPKALIYEMLHNPKGCTGGRGGSSHLNCKEIDYFGHCGLIGNEVSIAIGAAFASGRKTLAFIGDAAMEEDYVLSAFGFASKHQSPVLFIGEDNNLSILTEKHIRRTWSSVDVVKAFGIPSVEIEDDPWLIMEIIENIKTLPFFINVVTTREYWHAGTGQDEVPGITRFDIIKETMNKFKLEEEAIKIEAEENDKMTELWNMILEEQNHQPQSLKYDSC